jgi:hypothetical protein
LSTHQRPSSLFSSPRATPPGRPMSTHRCRLSWRLQCPLAKVWCPVGRGASRALQDRRRRWLPRRLLPRLLVVEVRGLHIGEALRALAVSLLFGCGLGSRHSIYGGALVRRRGAFLVW